MAAAAPDGPAGRPAPAAPAGERAPPSALVSALVSAAQNAVIALLLAFPLLTFRTIESESRLVLDENWSRVFIAVAVVFAVSLVGALARGRLAADDSAGSSMVARLGGLGAQFGTALDGLGRFVGPALVVFAVVLPWTPFADRYIMDLAILVMTYVMLGWGLNVVVGLAGLLDLGYVAFYAVGAYSYALLAQYFGLSFWLCLPLAGILAAFWGILLGFPVLRLRGDYLAIVTLAFGEIIRIVLINFQELTGGPNGLSGIPRPSFFGLEFKADCSEGTFCGFFGLEHSSLHRIVWLYYIIVALALLTGWVTQRVRRLPVGRAWEALREDEIACRSLGIDTTLTKLTAFAMGAMFGGFAGSFFATRQGFISPESFTFLESAMILAIVVLGGMGSQIGIAIAAIVLVGGVELFRELEIWRMLVFGMAMVAIMIWRPRGLVGTRSPSISLGKARVISSDLVGEGHG